MKKVLVSILLLFTFLLLFLTYVAREFLVPSQTETKTIRVAILRGMPASEIARALDEQGVIRHAWSFQLLLRLTKTAEKIVAGTYDLSPSMSEYEILKTLLKGNGVLMRITIPEGYNLKQIAHLLSENGVVDEDSFLPAARQTVIEVPTIGLKTQGAEGFLFPDTYDLEPHISAEEAMKPMFDRFKQMVVPIYIRWGLSPTPYTQAHSKLTLQQIVTLASMVEREGKVRDEFPLIASVYYNRLKGGIPLQCDATIQYVLPQPKELLGEEDLKIDSPYNTYLHPGFPPGPIGSPGLAAIKAALYPAHSAYLYYVLQDSGGHHVFSATYAEHLHAVEHYRQWLLKRVKG